MKKLIAIVCASLFSGVFADTVLYVKPGGTGEGTSWSDAAELETAIATAKAGKGTYSIYLAEGVYYPAAMLHIGSGIALYGGFEGVSMAEKPETRDIAAHPSIISGDTKKNDRWELFDTANGTSSDTGALIVQDGKIFVPKIANDYDTVAPLESTVSYSNDNLVRVISIAVDSDASCVVDGVTIQGGGWTAGKYSNITEDGWNCDYGGAIFAGEGASPIVRNCRIVGCYGMRSCVYFYSKDTKATPVFENNTIEYCRTAFSGAFSTYGASVAVAVKDCEFVGNVRATTMSDAYGCAALGLQNGMRLDNCFFTRNHVQHAESNASSSICVSVGYAITAFVTDCRFEKNSSYSTIGEAVPVVNYAWRSGSMQRCKFLGNKTVCGGKGTLVEGVSCIRTERTCTIVEECVFANNTVFAVSDADGATVVAATTLAKGTETDLVFANCIFADNAVDAVVTGSGAVAREARSVMSWRTGEATTITMGVLCQCTSVGAETAPDLVNFGAFASPAKSVVINSVLWSDAEGARVESEVGGDVEVKSSIMRGASSLPKTIAVSDTVEYDPAIETELIDGVPCPRISVRNPGNKCIYDVATFGYYGTPIFAYAPAGTTAWTEFHGYGGGTKVLIGDILGEKRESGDFTKGAVQSLTPTAVKYTFDLGDRGTFEDGSSVKTFDLFTGDVVEVPTFTVADGYTFRKWRGEIPAKAGDVDATFKAYYWGPIIEIDGGDDLAEVLAQAKTQEGGAEIVFGAGDYLLSAKQILPANVTLAGKTGARIVSTVAPAIDNWNADLGEGVLRISGLSFTGGGVDAGEKCPVELVDCVFTNATSVRNGVAFHTKGHATVVGCTFVDNTQAIRTDASEDKKLVVKNTLFRANRATSNGCAIGASNPETTVENCDFIGNTNSICANGYGIVGLSDYGKMRIVNSRFVRNVADNGALTIVLFPNYTENMVSNCLFLANEVIGDRGNNSAGVACVLNARRTNHLIYNTAFVSNRIVRTETATKAGVTEMRAEIVYSEYHPVMWNDTFVGNVVSAQTSQEGVAAHASICSFAGGAWGPIVSLTFKDNVAADGDVYSRCNNGVGSQFFNCIFTGGDDHRCISRTAEKTPVAKFYNCVVNDAPAEDWVTLNNCITETPKFVDEFTVRDGVWSLMLTGDSVGRRGGIQIYRSANNLLVYNDGTSWRRCDTSGTNALQPPYEPLADVYGMLPKAENRVVCGAVQDYRRNGLLLLVR